MKRTVLLGFLAVAMAACSKGTEPPGGKTENAPSATDSVEADTIFTQRCATCHGAAGKGDGPVALTLNPKPRDFGDKAWQASVTDAHIEKIILEGGPSVGKNVAMPPNPDLALKTGVIRALRMKVRKFGQ
jgi:mono/diheme cytochrome c family protein